MTMPKPVTFRFPKSFSKSIGITHRRLREHRGSMEENQEARGRQNGLGLSKCHSESTKTPTQSGAGTTAAVCAHYIVTIVLFGKTANGWPKPIAMAFVLPH